MLYVQDYDQTYPPIRFHGYDSVWRNAIQPCIKNLGVLACPSDPTAARCPPDPTRRLGKLAYKKRRRPLCST
jgi:hypothetical protein